MTNTDLDELFDVKNGMFLDRDLFVLFWSQGSALDKPKVWSR